MSTAIRLVRCPKCRKIIPELPNIPLYKCGGCGAILQAKKHISEIKGNVLRHQETDPIQKDEPNSVSSSSSPEGDHPSIESSPGSDARGQKFSSRSPNSEKPVDSNFSDQHSQLTKPTYLRDEAAVQGKHERLLDQEAGLQKTEPLNHSRENQHDRLSDNLSDYYHSCHEKEDSSSEISISENQFEERPKLNVVTSENEIDNSHGVVVAEEKCTGEPKSSDQLITPFSMGKNLMDVENEGQNGVEYTNETEGSHGVLTKEERCYGEPQSLDDPETNSPESEPLKLVATEKHQNTENQIGNYTNDMEDSHGELSEQGSHSNESQSFDEPATHYSTNAPLKSDEENELFAEDTEHGKVDERNYSSRKKDSMKENDFPDQIQEYSQKGETEKETSSSMKDSHKVEVLLLVEEECSVADENSRRYLEKRLGPQKDEEITAVQGPLSRSIVFAPLSPNDAHQKESHEVAPSSHRISSEQNIDTLPINPRVPVEPPSPDDIYLRESHEIGPSFHRISSEEMLDTLPRDPIVPIAPLSSDDIYLEDSHEVSPSFHRISSEETLDTLPSNPIIPIAPLSSDDIYLLDSHEIGPSFHRISSEERLDTSPNNPIVPIAPLSSDDIYLEDSHEVGPSFHRISSEEMLDTFPINPRVQIAPHSPDDIYLKESQKVGPGFHRITSDETMNTLPIHPKLTIAPLSPDNMYLEDSLEVGPNFHRISSEGMLVPLPINPRVPIGSMGKSPTKRYYSGDGSESQYDGAEGLSARVSHQYNRKLKATGTESTNRSRQKDGFRVKNKQNGELQTHNEQYNLLSKCKEPNTYSVSERDWRLHESPEHRKHSHPFRSSMIATNSEPISRSSFIPMSSQLFHGNGNAANSTHNIFLPNGEFPQRDTMLGSEPEKRELLRMVYELEDQINRTHMSKQVSGERLPFRDVGEEIRTGRYYDDPATVRNSYVDIKYSRNHISHRQGVGQANLPTTSRLGFSGEALCRNHIDCRCSYCVHQDWHFSPKLSSHCIHCQHVAPPRHDYDNIYPSYSPSPQHYTSSEFSHEMQTDNQKHDTETNILYLRERHQVMKRHLRPVSGGAPIITCYHCSELLQLPADFLLFKRRCHQLRCDSCNKILKFSLQKDSHIVPYVIKIQAPLPRDMGNYSNITDKRTVASISHAKTPQDAFPISFSDDFEPSFSGNGSTESGPSVPSSLSMLKNLSNGEPSSNHTFQAMNDRKMKTVMEIYQDVNGSSSSRTEAARPSSSTSTLVKPSTEIEELHATSGPPLHRLNGSSSSRTEAAGPTSSTSTLVKPSTEIEELRATSGPPLHRLMGYESPRQVLFARSEDESDDGMVYYMNQQIR